MSELDAAAAQPRDMFKPTWEFFTTQNYEEAIHWAKDHGWANKDVQVRIYTRGEEVIYNIEPYERDCDCPSILKYSKAFPE